MQASPRGAMNRPCHQHRCPGGAGKLARCLQALVLGLLALAVAWTACAWKTDAGLAVAGLMAAASLHPLVLAFELLLVKLTHRSDPSPRAPAGMFARAWWAEIKTSLRVFLWQQPFRSRVWPDHLPCQNGPGSAGRGVLLVHGYVCNRGLWNTWMQKLTAAGRPFVAVNLEPVLGSIDQTIAAIEDAVGRLEFGTGMPPVVVAHSMGGLVVRRWWATQPSHRLHHVITLGTPHQGTWLARWGLSLNARQMRPGSPWLSALVAQEPPERAQAFTCFYSHTDNIVFPPSCATLPGAQHRHLCGYGHVHLVQSPEAWQALQQCLDQTAPPQGHPHACRQLR
jgi:triacylglycerol lipase